MARLGDDKLNLFPCTQEDEQYNLSVLNSFQQTVNNFIEGGEDSGKVYVSSADDTWNYLHDKMTTQATRDTDEDPLIAVAIGNAGGVETLTLFLDSSAIDNYSDTGLWVLSLNNGNAEWYDASTFGGGGGGADILVQTSNTDTAGGEYLSAKMEDYTGASPAYAAGDLLVQCDLTNSGGAENLRFYANTNSYPGYSATGTWALCLDDNVWTWVDISNGVTYTEGYAIDITGGAIAFDHTEIDGWGDGELLGKSGSTLTFGDLGVDLSSTTGSVTISITFDGTEIATDSVAVDTYKLKVSASDTTTNYLYPKLADSDNYSATEHQLVYAEVVAGEQVRLFTDKASANATQIVELITFIYHSYTEGAIDGASYTSGPTIQPTLLNVEKMEKDTETDRLEPTGEFIEVEYRDGTSLPQLSSGFVYVGEALQVGSLTPVVIAIYCKQWAEAGA